MGNKVVLQLKLRNEVGGGGMRRASSAWTNYVLPESRPYIIPLNRIIQSECAFVCQTKAKTSHQLLPRITSSPLYCIPSGPRPRFHKHFFFQHFLLLFKFFPCLIRQYSYFQRVIMVYFVIIAINNGLFSQDAMAFAP